MTTPKQLAALAKDRCWGYQRLADEIYDVTRVRFSSRTIRRLMNGQTQPRESTQNAIDKFMKAAKSARYEASR